MRRYLVELHAVFEVKAENVIQARIAAKRIRAMDEVLGVRKGGVHFAVRKTEEVITWKRLAGANAS